jgi:CHAT domain-containing protein
VGIVLNAQGEYEEALKHCRLALQMYQRLYPRDKYPHGHPDLARSRSNVGGVLQAQGEHEEALKHFHLALQMRQHEVERLASSAPEDRALNFAASLPLTRDALLSVSSHSKDSAAAVYAAVWSSRSVVSRVLERRHLQLLAASSSAEVKGLHARLLALRQQRSRLLLAPLPRDTTARDEHLDKLAADIEQVEKKLLPLLPALKQSQQLAHSTPMHLQKALPARTAFVDLLRYVHFDRDPKVKGTKGERRSPRYVAFVLTRERQVRVDLGEARRIEEVLALWRRALSEGSDAAAEHARRVRSLLWQKVEKELDGIDTVYLAPDGKLTQLPFAALPGDRAGTVVLEKMALAVVPHGVVLLDRLSAAPAKGQRKGDLLAVAAVSYDDRPSAAVLAKAMPAPVAADRPLKWEFLSGTGGELKQIQSLPGAAGVRTLTGSNATTARVLAELPKARLAHLATHGFFADPRFRSVLQLDEKLFTRRTASDSDFVRRVGAGARNPLVLSGLVLAPKEACFHSLKTS